MQDFGNGQSEWSTCQKCGSRRHETHAHTLLDEAAPELLEAAKKAIEIINWVSATPYERECIKDDVKKIESAISTAEGKPETAVKMGK